MSKFKRLLFAFIPAWICTFILASVSHSQFVLAELSQVGIVVSMSDRLAMTADDLLGLALSYGIVIAIALTLGFLLIQILVKLIPALLPVQYPIAGAISFVVMFEAMQPLLHITLIAGARTDFGYLIQCLSGVFGGFVFARLLKDSTETSNAV